MKKEEFLNYKLGIREQISYGFSYFGGNLLANMVASFVTFYYTNSVGITAAVVGTMILISKFLDGISDFLMALLIEKTNTKMGKAKPWLVAGIVPMSISLVLLFSCPAGLSDAGKIVWMYFTYIFCNVIAYTAVVLSGSTMLVLMTGNVNERTKASVWGSILGSISILIVAMFTENMASQIGWFRISLVYAILAMITMIFAAIFCKERHHLITDSVSEEIKKEKSNLKEDLKVLVKNKYFWNLLFISMLKFATTGAAMGVAAYYFLYVLGNSALYGIVTMVWFIPPMIGNMFLPKLTEKVGYRRVLAWGFIIQAIGWLIEAYAPSMGLLYLGAFLVGIGGTNATLLFPLIGDIVDYGELKQGVPLTGLTNSGYSIGVKVGTGIGGALVGWILTFVGFDGMATIQSATALGGIKFIFGVIPFITSLVAGIVSYITRVEEDLKEIRG